LIVTVTGEQYRLYIVSSRLLQYSINSTLDEHCFIVKALFTHS
jgi:hypothetical protein